MPHVRIETNVELDRQAALATAKKASALCAESLDKPEQYVQVLLHESAVLLHGGNENPAAYVELKSIGLAKGSCKELSRVLCEFLETELQIPASRVYIEFLEIEPAMLGWNKSTF